MKLIWTREEEFTWAYFRPAGVIRISSSVGEDGILRSWEFHNYLSGPSGLKTPYEVPAKNEQFHRVESPLREGSYRGPPPLPPITSLANRTWMSWPRKPAWIPWRSG